ncbi:MULTISPECIES: NAD(P)-dependent alcohol dehydrogenase [unclassified Novosphingobium]|uniref:zinc-dependent alcohol dehydrogenase family protein n=1 Tax=unclassified Novosphingobium TaxID=2644732 RepID=UPI00135C2660|nr:MULTISPECIES: NAD(P)-dependent alcohol dehydrogenase [unclassified Novosphingobium]
MKAYEVGAMDGLSSWRQVERASPAPGLGQVLIRVKAVSLNYRDILIVNRQYGFSDPSPDLIPVSDGAGEVIGIGEGVTRWKLGDRVAGIFSQSWFGGAQVVDAWDTTLGGAVDGMLAEYVVLHENGLVRIPDHLTFAQAATLPVAAVTAWNALYGLKPLQPGQTVLTLGTGGVSIFAIQLARAAGARVIATSSSSAKLEKAKALGAHDVINYRETPEWHEEVRRLTAGRGVDHVIEIGGAGTIPKSIASTHAGGVVSLIGVLAQGEPLDPLSILGTSTVVRGIMVGSREMFEAMNAAISQHTIEPVIDQHFAFDQAKEALAALAKGEHVGKIVIDIA